MHGTSRVLSSISVWHNQQNFTLFFHVQWWLNRLGVGLEMIRVVQAQVSRPLGDVLQNLFQSVMIFISALCQA